MSSKLAHLLDKFRYLYYLIQYVAALLLAPFLRNKEAYKNLWIISERGIDARDNGLHLFRYIRTEHPEINICFIISKDSKDRAKVAELGKVIDYRSFRHYLALAMSEVKISTHIMGYAPDMYFFKVLDARWPLKGVKAFLQHGIIKDALPYLYGDSVKLDLFVCGAKKEWEYIDATFGHPKDVARYLGLCRYDRLPCETREKPNGIILLMPTWRQYIADQVFSAGKFKKTEFYRCYQELLSSPVLYRLLEEYGFVLKFYPHHEMQRYLSSFQTEHDRVEIVDTKKLDVQQAMIEADVMITDYSSVFFDFAYMMKPELFYQFDQEEFRAKHYAEGYFQYERDAFGPVCLTQEHLLAELEQVLKANCVMSGEYARRAEAFFELRDHDNCKRNFQAIYGLWKGAN